jgi:hypothetical protein
MTDKFNSFVRYVLENLNLSLFEEKLVLKKKTLDDGSVIFVVDSDLEGSAASNETFRKKDEIRGSGLFFFDKTNLRKWISKKYSPEEFERNIPLFSNVISKINGTFEDIASEIEEIVDLGMKDKIAGFLQDLKAKIKEDANSQDVQQFFEFRKKFHRYSFNNQILIFIQKRNATRVAGKNKWLKEFNRKIKAGAKGIYIFVPISSKMRDESDAAAASSDADETKTITRFILKPVFDISDTEPIEGKEDKGVIPEEPKWFDETPIDEKSEIIYKGLMSFAKRKNIDVTVDAEGLDGARGVSRVGNIQLLTDNISTLVHELAHEILHDIETRKSKDKTVLELQAESVAYVVLREFGLPTEHASKYMALWRIDPEHISENENEIRNAAAEIIDYVYEFGNDLIGEKE